MKLAAMKRPGRRGMLYALLAAGSFLFFLLASFPAQLAYQYMVQPALGKRLQLEGLQGTVWQGSATSIRIANLPLGRFEWKVQASSLLMGRLQAEVAFRGGETQGKGIVSAGLSGAIRLHDVKAQLPAQTLMALAYGFPMALDGELAVELQQAEIIKGEALRVDGRVNWINAATTAPQQLPIGNLSLVVRSKDAGSEAELTQLDGELFNIAGQFQVKGNGQYKFSATVAVKDPAREDLKTALYLIGRPGPDGAANVLYTGTLSGW